MAGGKLAPVYSGCVEGMMAYCTYSAHFAQVAGHYTHLARVEGMMVYSACFVQMAEHYIHFACVAGMMTYSAYAVDMAEAMVYSAYFLHASQLYLLFYGWFRSCS